MRRAMKKELIYLNTVRTAISFNFWMSIDGPIILPMTDGGDMRLCLNSIMKPPENCMITYSESAKNGCLSPIVLMVDGWMWQQTWDTAQK